MTVAELLEELRGRDPDMEVVLSVEDSDGDPLDVPLFVAYVSLGRVFLSGEGDE